MIRPFVFAIGPAFVLSAVQAQSNDLPEAPHALPYKTVAAALQALKTNPDVTVSLKDGWTIAVERKGNAVWSFPPPGHPAYPAAVERESIPVNGFVTIQMRVLCEASKSACDKLVNDFKTLNEQVRKNVQERLEKRK